MDSTGASSGAMLVLSGVLLGAAFFVLLPTPEQLDGWKYHASLGVVAWLLALAFVWWVFQAVGVAPGQLAALTRDAVLPAIVSSIGLAGTLYAIRRDDVPEHAIAGALFITALGLVPLVNVLTGGRALAWYPTEVPVWIRNGLIVGVCAFVLAAFMGTRLGNALRALRDGVMSFPAPAFAALAAVIALGLAVSVALYCFRSLPRNSDEIAQLFHAKILLTGRLSLPQDPNPEFFAIDNMIDRGRWYSQFPIGGAAVLAVGLLLHAAWLVNPVLAALSVVNVYLFARSTYTERFARGATILYALSPLMLFMGGTFMNHVPVLFLVTLALAALPRWLRTPNERRAWPWAALIGIAVGGIAAIRPYDAAIVAVPIGTMQLLELLRRHERWRSLAAQFAAGLIPVTALLWANARTTGSAFRFGYELLYGDAHGVGFHVDPYGEVHSPLRGLQYASRYLLELNPTLSAWTIPSLLVVVCALLLMRRSGEHSRWDALLLALAVGQVVAYAFYWHNGEFLGPRFLYSAIPAFILLAARAPMLAAERLTRRPFVRHAVLLVIPLLTLAALIPTESYFSAYLQAKSYRSQRRSYHPDPVQLVRQQAPAGSLVFVDEGLSGRAFRRLWALGVPRAATNRILVGATDACSVVAAIMQEEQQPGPRETREARLAAAAKLPRRAVVEPWCERELESNRDSGLEFGRLLLANELLPDGSIGGRVIYAADLGARNEILRARFGNRQWFRLTARREKQDVYPALVPYR
jgi:hypothetical protein